MSWIGDIFKGGAEGLLKGVGDIADEFHLSGEEKQDFQLRMKALIQQRDSEVEATFRSELQAKEHILVAELNQGDNYTKRARPTVVYVGLAVIVFNYCIVPLLLKLSATIAVALAGGAFQELAGIQWEPLTLPKEFWMGWSGIVATWSIGRSAERRGIQNKAVQMVTGSKLLPSLVGALAVACVWAF